MNPSDWIRHWRHPNHLMLAVPWPGFFGLIAAGYLLLNLLFALIFWADPDGIAGVAGETTSFLEAFFFSVQTLGSIAYGAFHPSSLFTHLVVTVESLLGLIVIALTTGMAFSRFSRSTARILFSEVVTVHDYDGQPTLMFRLANERRKTILEARVQAFLAIDEHSPLHGRTSEELLANQAEIVMAFSGIDETLERPIYAHHNGPASQMLFGQGFVDMMPEEDGQGQCFDFANFNRTQPCPCAPA